MNDYLNTCHCCEDESEQPELYSPPGQSALSYRIGVHSSFLRRMLARLGSETIPDGDHAGQRPLRDLTTRNPDDFAIALLDAWASVGDILTFYQERLANEGFLRTATERRSVLELARAIGYELKPGVAAETYLAFTVDTTGFTPESILVPVGTQVQSIPQAQGELPQTFETPEEITAHAVWNELRPALTTSPGLESTDQTIYLEGTTTNLRPGDMLLLVLGTSTKVIRVTAVTPDNQSVRTAVTLEQSAGLTGAVGVYALREKASIFGHNAPLYNSLSDSPQSAFANWDEGEGWDIWHDSTVKDEKGKYYTETGGADIFLDRPISGLKVDDYIVLRQKGGFLKILTDAVYQINEIVERSMAGFALSGSLTGLMLRKLDGNSLFNEDKDSDWKVRKVTAYCRSDPLTLARTPLLTPIPAGATQVILAGADLGLSAGQWLAISGQTPGDKPQAVAELRQITVIQIEQGTDTTLITLGAALNHDYDRETMIINANVVAASHGESVKNEILGGGDGTQANQRFTLRKPPLTHVSAETASGRRSTLTVRVDGVAWSEVPSLYGQPPEARVFIVRIDNEARPTLIFGDGKSGARLPTGQENVAASYRSGTGLAGEVAAGTLTLLMTRPYGVTGVSNPLAADGAEDPEKLADARENAPLAVLTLDRIVSLRDFEDFARAFAGIGKALATAAWSGEQEVVYLTVADMTGDNLDPASKTYTNLKAAIEKNRDPWLPVALYPFESLTFTLSARLLIDPAYVWEDVLTAAGSALIETFSFAQRNFARPVTAAEIMALLQAMAGVMAVDIDELYLTGQPTGFEPVLPCWPPLYDPESGTVGKAQLLLIDPAALSLTEMTET